VRLGPGLHHACSLGLLGLKRASRSKTCKHQVTVVALQSKVWLKRVWRFQDGFTHLTEDPSVLALLRKQHAQLLPAWLSACRLIVSHCTASSWRDIFYHRISHLKCVLPSSQGAGGGLQQLLRLSQGAVGVDMPGDRPHEAQRKGACLGVVAPAQPLPWRRQGLWVCRPHRRDPANSPFGVRLELAPRLRSHLSRRRLWGARHRRRATLPALTRRCSRTCTAPSTMMR